MGIEVGDITEIERATVHLIPQHPEYHGAGLSGFAYAGIGLAVQWLVVAIGFPSAFSWIPALAAAYFSARYDGGLVWKPYHQRFNQLIKERTDQDD